MNSKEIKNFIKTVLGITCPLSVTTNPTLDPYIDARIRPTKNADVMAPLEYPASFPVAFRTCAIAAVYGCDSSLTKQAAAGNIGAHSIAMKAHQWRLAVALYAKCV